MAYSPEIKVEAKRLIVIEQMTPAKASEHVPPAASTIAMWARQEDDDGKTWYDLRKERAQRLYEDTSPQAMARKLLQRIDTLLNEGSLSPSEADALSKYTKVMRSVAAPKYQVSVMYQFLTELVEFLKTHYPEAFTEELADALRDFRTQLRERLGEPK